MKLLPDFRQYTGFSSHSGDRGTDRIILEIPGNWSNYL